MRILRDLALSIFIIAVLILISIIFGVLGFNEIKWYYVFSIVAPVILICRNHIFIKNVEKSNDTKIQNLNKEIEGLEQKIMKLGSEKLELLKSSMKSPSGKNQQSINQTTEKHAANALQLITSQRVFLHSMASPINTISLAAEMVLENNIDRISQKDAEMLEKIKAAADNLSKMVSENRYNLIVSA